MVRPFVGAVAACVVACCAPLAGATRALTLSEAVSRARSHAPEVVAARATVEEARGRLDAAAPWLRDNPTVDVSVGRRRRDGTDAREHLWGVSQTVELAGQRGTRRAAARAGLAEAAALHGEASAQAALVAGGAFLAARADEERLAIAAAAESVALDLARVAERRAAAADLGALDVALARARRRGRAAIARRQRRRSRLTSARCASRSTCRPTRR